MTSSSAAFVRSTCMTEIFIGILFKFVSFFGMCFKKYETLFVLVVLIGIREQVNGFLRRSVVEEDICNCKSCENRTSGFLQNHCGSNRLGRCCLDSKNVTIGCTAKNLAAFATNWLITLSPAVVDKTLTVGRWVNPCRNNYYRNVCLVFTVYDTFTVLQPSFLSTSSVFAVSDVIRVSKLDLGNCSLKTMMSLSRVANIKWINLASNNFNITKCKSSKFFSDSFEGLTKLERVYLDDNCTCPGSNVVWNYTKHFGNETKMCYGQLSTCQYFNETCPSHSVCSSYGPGFYECKCLAQWTGYKCLVKGGIPLAIFLGGITGGMVLLTLVIFFLQLRRKRMYSQGYLWIDGTATRGSMHS